MPGEIDLAKLARELEQVLKLRAIPIGMQLFETVADMEAIPKVRRPKGIYTADQIVGQAARLGWTVGVTAADLFGAQCAAVLGIGPQDAEWRSGRHMKGVWYGTDEDAAAHQAALPVVPEGRYRAMAVSPLASGWRACSALSAAACASSRAKAQGSGGGPAGPWWPRSM